MLEDDDGIRNLVLYALNGAGLESEGFDRPGAFYAAMRRRPCSLLLLDVMLPEEDGLTVLKKLRADPLTEKLAVILLTARGTEYDRVLGLECGADDYVTKPFSVLELLARVRAQLRRIPEEQDEVLCAGPVRLSEKEHRVESCGEAVALTPKEFSLLALLMRNRGVALTRDAILERVWGYAFDGENRTVDVHMRSLRAKLGAGGGVIETVRGVGYRISRQT